MGKIKLQFIVQFCDAPHTFPLGAVRRAANLNKRLPVAIEP